MLHTAIAEVLESSGRAMSPAEIAEHINRHGLYSRRDGSPLPANQVSARIRRYPALFSTTPAGIKMHNLPATAVETSPIPSSTEDSTPTFQSGTTPDAVASRLLARDAFRSAADIDDGVPEWPGLYAIRIKDANYLPSPYREAAAARGTDLLYLGQATRRTLRHRFVRNELRGNGHGTFFRSIGAVLGYRPPVGSLIGKANTRNYRFSAADTDAIVDWINRHLEVSWVALDVDDIHQTEVTLIRAHRPLLNLRDNPAALVELSALRRACSVTAMHPAT